MRRKDQNSLRPILTPEEIDCLRPFSVESALDEGDVVFMEGVSSDTFFVILEGRIRVSRQVAGQELLLAVHLPGGFTGDMSVITGEGSLTTGVAVGACRVLHMPSDRFHDATRSCPELMTIVLPVLAQRSPAILAMQSEREKLVALGTLAAGFAHELNNPASAAARGASLLRPAVKRLVLAAVELCHLGLDECQMGCLKGLVEEVTAREVTPLNPLDRSDREELVDARLTSLGIKNPGDMASVLLDAGFTEADAARMAAGLPACAMLAAITWVAAALRVESLVSDVRSSTSRVSDLVHSIKNYSYSDQAPVQQIDIHDGIDVTLRVLDQKLRAKSISVERCYGKDVPMITAYPSELNQVWTNLIDNAIGAMKEGGMLKIRTAREGPCVKVDVEDNGEGIAPAVMPRIFEPFFTTKRTGEGTGLGLDISYNIVVEHHHGDIFAMSEPGCTTFHVRIPIELASANQH